jgi:hypothetical protein
MKIIGQARPNAFGYEKRTPHCFCRVHTNIHTQGQQKKDKQEYNLIVFMGLKRGLQLEENTMLYKTGMD